LAIYTFTENDVFENLINTLLIKKIIAVLVTGILMVFVHKGVINPIFGEDSKTLNRGISLILLALANFYVFKQIDKRNPGLKKFTVTPEVRSILIIAVLFIASA